MDEEQARRFKEEIFAPMKRQKGVIRREVSASQGSDIPSELCSS